MANIELLDRIIQKIQDEPGSWNQFEWASRNYCGTSYCIAGWACVLGGYEIAWSDGKTYSDSVYASSDKYWYETEMIEEVAERLLEIDRKSADKLFAEENKFEDIIEMRKKLQEFGTLDDTR